jgi:hypothetical protein
MSAMRKWMSAVQCDIATERGGVTIPTIIPRPPYAALISPSPGRRCHSDRKWQRRKQITTVQIAQGQQPAAADDRAEWR